MGRPEAPSALPCNQQWPRHSATGTQGRCCRMLTGCGSHSRPTSSTPNRTHPPTSGAGRGVGPPQHRDGQTTAVSTPLCPTDASLPITLPPGCVGSPTAPSSSAVRRPSPPPLPPRAGALRPPCGAKRPPRYPECRSPNRRDPKPGRGSPPSPPPYPTTASWAPPLTAPQRTPGPPRTSLSPTRPDLTPGPTPHLPQPHPPPSSPSSPPSARLSDPAVPPRPPLLPLLPPDSGPAAAILPPPAPAVASREATPPRHHPRGGEGRRPRAAATTRDARVEGGAGSLRAHARNACHVMSEGEVFQGARGESHVTRRGRPIEIIGAFRTSGPQGGATSLAPPAAGRRVERRWRRRRRDEFG